MGWPWGSSKGEDWTQKLDPQLQEFLKQESPALNKPEAPPPPPPEPTTTTTATTPQEPEKPKVPPQSQFPDGRYAHIWKTYRPLSEVEAAAKSDNEKISDLAELYRDRQSAVKRVASENCIIQQIALADCEQKPAKWSETLTKCTAENRALIRCNEVQRKFLRALGYLQVYGSDPEAQERIQMHSDLLYNRMLEQEEAVAQAKAKGEPIPQFGNILSQENVAATMSGATTVQPETSGSAETAEKPKPKPFPTTFDECEGMSDRMRDELEKKLLDVHGAERDVERQALIAEFMADKQMAEVMGVMWATEKEKRQRRIDMGKATMGDKIKQFWGH